MQDLPAIATAILATLNGLQLQFLWVKLKSLSKWDINTKQDFLFNDVLGIQVLKGAE